MTDIIYYNGTIITADEYNSICEAILISDGIIRYRGSTKEIFEFKTEETVLYDLNGKTMLPGFIDPHSHITAVAQTLSLTRLDMYCSRDELIEGMKIAIKDKSFKEGEWFIGFGYDNALYEDEIPPNRYDLDEVCSTIPIMIGHISGHVGVTNSLGLKLLGYDKKDIKDPYGGKICRFEDSGEANGVLEENAFMNMDGSMTNSAKKSEEDSIKVILEVEDYYIHQGFTSAFDASIVPEQHELLKKCSELNKLKIDIYSLAVEPYTKEMMIKDGSNKYKNHYKLGGVKTWLDGSPQAKTAWLSEPYYKIPKGITDNNYKGYARHSDEELIEYYKLCLNNNWQVHSHCNGDAAADQFIRCYKKAIKLTHYYSNTRPVLVHCQLLRKEQIDELKLLNVVPTVFNDHVYYWGDYHYKSVFGSERSENISPIGWMLEKKMKFTLHQDSPVKLPNAIFAIHNAVNRKTRNGLLLGEKQRISVMDAIKAVTINGAYQNMEEDFKGSIEVGKFADLVVLDKNPLIVNVEDLKDIKVIKTIKEGNIIYENNKI